MRVTITTEPALGHINEDFAAATANAVVLLDGAGLSGVDNGGCIHGVTWYVRRLGSELLARLAHDSALSLAQILADVIGLVSASHDTTCDVNHPGTPSSTVVMVDVRGPLLRYLVLADSVLVINELGKQRVVSDGREAETGRLHRRVMDSIPAGTPAHDDARRAYVETLRAHRNRPGGFWVAAADPQAASEALTGEVDRERVESLLLLSDGASRPVDRFGILTWHEIADLVANSGGPALLRRVRDAENSDPHGMRWPRGKIHDDATVVYCDFPHMAGDVRQTFNRSGSVVRNG
ncbi:hypothetical protein [Micromonospora sp. WMMD1082]|uniref:hypothetical protein n=1 Tax=Micromonospora sp. WMMD1082 TaxID=3016104 RepID=UPI002417A54B|nr:hypothetical protein [Micromonospora sp. WMMD1082]MDG4795159.1 hypothetical protein [Micromonospora sp. WMMD1082]